MAKLSDRLRELTLEQSSCVAAFCIISGYTILKPFKYALLKNYYSMQSFALLQALIVGGMVVGSFFIRRLYHSYSAYTMLSRVLGTLGFISIGGAFFIGHILAHTAVFGAAVAVLLSFFLEITLPLSLSFLWSLFHSSPALGGTSYTRIIFAGQLGAATGGIPGVLFPLLAVGSYTYPALFIASALCYGASWYALQGLMATYEHKETTQMIDERPDSTSIATHPIARFIVGTTLVHEAIRSGLEYALLASLPSSGPTTHKFLAIYELCAQSGGLFFSWITTLQPLSSFRALLAMPFICIAASSICALFPTPMPILVALCTIQATFNGLFYPYKQMLYRLLAPPLRIHLQHINAAIAKPSAKIARTLSGGVLALCSLPTFTLFPLSLSVLFLIVTAPIARIASLKSPHH